MNAEILAVGTELLLGDTANTHAQYLAKELSLLGINLHYQSVVGDNPGRLADCLNEALSRSDLILLTGGLGPTGDDLTKETVCEVMGVELVPDEEALARIEAYFKRLGRGMPDNNRKQAMVPKDSTVFYNEYGTAPGMAIQKDGKCVVMLPGPPRELIPMFRDKVRPFLEKFADGKIVSHSLMAAGIGESTVAEKLGHLLDGENPTAALYAKDGEVQIRVTAKANTTEEAERLTAPVIREVTRRLGDYIYGEDVPNLHSVVVNLLREQKLMIATAESCTGGLLSQKLTEISGASEVFEFGVASYSNRVKEKTLGVPADILNRYGAVSSEVAMLMAVGAQREGGADIGVGITGIAGPDGGTEQTPVGRVFVAVSYRSKYWVEKLTIGHGGGEERSYIRNIATLHALNMVRLMLEGSPRAVGALADLPAQAIAAARTETEERKEKAIAATAAGAATASALSGFSVSSPANVAAAAWAEDVPAASVAVIGTDDPLEAFDEMEEEADGKKLPWYKRLAHYLFPWKGDSPQEIIRKVIFLIALITLIGSSIYIIDYLNAHVQSDITHNKTVELYGKEPTADELANLPDGYLEKFASLYAQNNEIKGWITIKNSRVNHPVMQSPQGDNDDFYLNHDFDRKSNRYGEPFIDARCTVGPNGALSTNTIIYGHNGAAGKVFCDVKNYTNINFYRGSPVINFDTVYEEAQWKVFGVFITNGSDDGGYFFRYHNFIEAQSEEHFDWFIRQVKKRTIINTPVDVKYGDQLLTLSTCSKRSDLEDGRVVVVARKVRPGESASVNTSKATKNPNPLYPDSWYKKHGGTAPYFEPDPDPTGGDNIQTDVPGGEGNSSHTTSRPTTSNTTPRPDDPPGPTSRPNTSSNGNTNPSSGGTSSSGNSSGGTPSNTSSGGTSSGDNSSDTSSGGTSSDTSSEDTSSTDTPSENPSSDVSSEEPSPSSEPEESSQTEEPPPENPQQEE